MMGDAVELALKLSSKVLLFFVELIVWISDYSKYLNPGLNDLDVNGNNKKSKQDCGNLVNASEHLSIA